MIVVYFIFKHTPFSEVDETAIYRVSMIEAESREEYQSKMEEDEEISASSAYKDLKSELEAIKTMVRTLISGTRQTLASHLELCFIRSTGHSLIAVKNVEIYFSRQKKLAVP